MDPLAPRSGELCPAQNLERKVSRKYPCFDNKLDGPKSVYIFTHFMNK